MTPLLPPPGATNGSQSRPDTRLGLVIRVIFFIASAFVGAFVFDSLTALIFHSAMLSAALGTFGTGLVANFMTMRIFDRRPLADIGLAGGQGSGRNFVIGLCLSALAAALLLAAPILAGTGH